MQSVNILPASKQKEGSKGPRAVQPNWIKIPLAPSGRAQQMVFLFYPTLWLLNPEHSVSHFEEKGLVYLLWLSLSQYCQCLHKTKIICIVLKKSLREKVLVLKSTLSQLILVTRHHRRWCSFFNTVYFLA